MSKLISIVTLALGLVWANLAVAQTVFVQIEAHPTLGTAEVEARRYAADLPDVNGFRFTTGWYVIALGPYDLDTAVRQLNTLRSQARIPGDSYLVDRNAYSNQFFPVGSNALTGAAITAPSQPVETTDTSESETPSQTETAIAPEPEAEPEETRREALRSESRLTRQEKFNLQIALQWFGFYNGAIDAAFGPGTRNSMAAWQGSKGYEQTGVLTTRQRDELTSEYEAVLASIGLRTVRDDRAGIELEIPSAMVAFDRYDPPFAHYSATGDSGVTVLLISQSGDENTLLGLYDIMQTLKIVPLDGERERRSNRFTLTGENSDIRSYTHAVLDGGEVKGFTLIWPAGDDQRFNVALKAMRESFTPLSGTVLPDTMGDGALEQSLDLISGLEIRRPEASRSGFYVARNGLVLTTTDAVNSCARVTLDEIYDATVLAKDDGLGLALLQPMEALAPLDIAKFQPSVPRLKSEIAVAGYSFEGALGAPTLTFGTLADLRGLQGEDNMHRLALSASPGDAGGPVFDASGSVMGMLLPRDNPSGKQLPAGVSFSADGEALATFLSDNGVQAAASDTLGAMSPEDLTRKAADLTVLVSCWGE